MLPQGYTKLFFIIDENIPYKLIYWLQEKGHTVSLVNKGISDEEIASLCKQTQGTLLTQDRHFANTLRFPPKNFPDGIIRLKIHPPFIEDLVFSLERLFEIFSRQEDFSRKLIVLEKYGFFDVKE